MLSFFAVITLAQATLTATQTAGDHPAVKIMALLQKLQAQVKEEGEAETNAYGKFTYWCGEVIKENEGIVKKSSEEISVAESSMKALTEDISALTTEIEQLEAELTKDTASKENADGIRTEQNTLYGTNKGDLEATIQAVDDAVTALEASKPALVQDKAVKKALAFVDVYAPKQGKSVHAFLSARRTKADPITSENADKFEGRTGRERSYDFKGGDIIETLKNLKTKFEDDLVEANKAETAAANSHSLADAAKQDEIDAAQRAKDTKTEVKARKEQDLADANLDLTEATDARTTAKTVLDDTTSSCSTRAGEWEQRSSRRAGEMEAMAKAIEILEKVTGVRAPEDKGVTFLQKVDDPSAKIVNLLRQAASKSKAKELTKLADRIAALSTQTPGSGVFDQIKNMIEKMIFHLMSEQKDEDDHKNWCDLEISKTTKMLEDKNATRDQLEVDIEALQTEIETLSTGISQNNEAVATLDTSIEQATADRDAERAENTATIKDAQDAQTAVDNAIAVLEDFYKSIGGVPKEAWELMQVRRAREDPPEPQPFSHDEYQGTEGGSGVIDLLTDVASDFASMEALARSDETTQQDQYDTFMTGAKIDKAAKQKDSEMKTTRKEAQSNKLMGKTKDQDHNNKELDATNKYWENLQPACVHGDSSYEDRKSARTQEIDALKQAQKILQDAFAETE